MWNHFDKLLGFLLFSFRLEIIFQKSLKTHLKVDVIELLYNELSSSQIKRERHVVDFVEWARPFMNRISELRVRKSDFDLVKVLVAISPIKFKIERFITKDID